MSASRWLAVKVICNIRLRQACLSCHTYRATASEHDEEPGDRARGPDDPRETDEEDHAEDVLDAGQVDADEGAHAGRGRRLRGVGVGRRRRRYRVGVVRQRTQKRGHPGPVFDLLLEIKKYRCVEIRKKRWKWL